MILPLQIANIGFVIQLAELLNRKHLNLAASDVRVADIQNTQGF